MTPADSIEFLEEFDFDAAEQPGLEIAGRAANALRGYLNGIDMRVARRAHALHEAGRSIPPEDLLSRSNNTSRRDAAKSQRRSETLGAVPAVEQQLAKGRISTEHADALTNASNRLDDAARARFLGDDAEIARAAAAMTPENFKRFLRRRADQMSGDDGLARDAQQRTNSCLSMGINDETGMGYVRGELHPEAYQRFKRAIDGEVAALRKQSEHEGKRTDQLNVVALVNLATGARSVGKRPLAQIVVYTDLETIMNGRHNDTTCEYSDGNPLPVAAARRLACDAEILPVVLNGDGMPLDVGRSKRLATPDQRSALRSMYRTCAIAGCERVFDDCEIHHLLEWIAGGHTDLINLLPVCAHHHHRAHEGRWRLELDRDTRALTVWLPNGTLLSRSLPDLVAERSSSSKAWRAA